MDSNRDFVHIDEVFQRLHQTPYSEVDANAAWSRMKGLLDEEMPVHPKRKPLVKRKYFYPLLLLIASATVSGTVWGYKAMNTRKATMAVANAGTTHKFSPLTSVVAVSSVVPPAVPEIKPNAPVTQPKMVDNSNTKSNNTALPKAIANTSNVIKPERKITNNNATNNSSVATNSTNGVGNSTSTPSNNPNTNSDFSDNNNVGAAALLKTSNDDIQPTINNIPVLAISNPTENNTPTGHQQNQVTRGTNLPSPIIETIGNNNSIDNSNYSNSANEIQNSIVSNTNYIENPINHLAMNSGGIEPKLADNIKFIDGKKFVQDEKGQWFKETQKEVPVTNKIKKVNPVTKNAELIAENTGKIFVIDRQPADEIEVVKLTVSEPIITTISINNFSSNKSNTLSFNNLSILNENRVKTITTNTTGQQLSNNYRKMRDDIARFFQNSDKLQAAINLGGIYTPSGTGGYGFNVGLTGIYSLSERLSLSVEARFVQKSFTNFYVEDVNKKYDIVQNGNIFNGTETISNQEYLVRGVSMFELPIYLSYNIGERLSFLGGLQFAYAAPIKHSSTSKLTINENYANMNKPFDQEFRVNNDKDFKAQSGLGYMFGVGFDVSKKISLDFRVNQNFSNNNSSSNSISNMFTTPTFNINIGYYFGKNDKIYYLLKR